MVVEFATSSGGAPQGAQEEDWRITHERGPMTRQVRGAAMAEGGEAEWEALLDTVSARCRARFQRPIGYFEWVESELALELHHAWILRKGEEFMAARGADAAREILQGAQSWLLRMATPGLLIQAMPKLFHFYYRGGELSAAVLAPGHARIELRASGYFPSWYQDALPAWAMEGLRLTGIQHLEAHYTAPPPLQPHLHQYDLRWDP